MDLIRRRRSPWSHSTTRPARFWADKSVSGSGSKQQQRNAVHNIKSPPSHSRQQTRPSTSSSSFVPTHLPTPGIRWTSPAHVPAHRPVELMLLTLKPTTAQHSIGGSPHDFSQQQHQQHQPSHSSSSSSSTSRYPSVLTANPPPPPSTSSSSSSVPGPATLLASDLTQARMATPHRGSSPSGGHDLTSHRPPVLTLASMPA